MQDNYSNYGIILPNGRTSGEVTTTCPKCSQDRKKKTAKCLGINLDKNVWNCNHCGWAGSLRPDKKEEIIYIRPPFKNQTTLSDRLIKWFEGRKITQKTLLKLRVSEGSEFMPQTSKNEECILFNYFKNGEIVNIKYRTYNKDFKLHKGSELTFYNIDCLRNELEPIADVYIVEGEIDALSMIEAGYNNVISVPNGGNPKNNNLSYLDSCIDLFNGLNIHLALDNDLPGRKLRDDIAERFGKDRCDYIEFKECKDANECLVKYGINGIIEACAKPIKFPLEGTFTISDYDNEIEDMYINGLDKGYDLKIPGFDLRIVKGYLTTITGIPGMGKSDWLDYICLQLRRLYGCKGAFYSPENKPTQLHFSKMARKLIGKNWDGSNRITPEEKNLVKDYLNGYFWFLKPEKDFTLTTILSQVRDLQRRHGLDFFVIDAWNKLEHKADDTNYIGKCLDEISLFCEMNNIHCFMVAHPKKMGKDLNGQYIVPTLYDIMGSAHFNNKSDNGICIYRDFDKQLSYVYRQKLKFTHWGTDGFSEYAYDVPSGRYVTGLPLDKQNWLIQNELPKLTPSKIVEDDFERDLPF